MGHTTEGAACSEAHLAALFCYVPHRPAIFAPECLPGLGHNFALLRDFSAAFQLAALEFSEHD